MKKLLIGLATLALIAGFGVTKAQAAESADITVTVTLQELSLSVTPDTVQPLGIMAPNATSSAIACTATNTGNAAEGFTIEVSPSVPVGWAPAGTAGVDEFVMTASGVGALTVAPQVLAATVAVSAVENFDLTFTAPSSTAGAYEQKSITVTVTAVP